MRRPRPDPSGVPARSWCERMSWLTRAWRHRPRRRRSTACRTVAERHQVAYSTSTAPDFSNPPSRSNSVARSSSLPSQHPPSSRVRIVRITGSGLRVIQQARDGVSVGDEIDAQLDHPRADVAGRGRLALQRRLRTNNRQRPRAYEDSSPAPLQSVQQRRRASCSTPHKSGPAVQVDVAVLPSSMCESWACSARSRRPRRSACGLQPAPGRADTGPEPPIVLLLRTHTDAPPALSCRSTAASSDCC